MDTTNGGPHYYTLLPRQRRSTTAMTTKTRTPTPAAKNAAAAAAAAMCKRWGLGARRHPAIVILAMSLVFFMGVEYTLLMVPPSSPPFDLGFVMTRWLNAVLAKRPALNTFLAGLNTVFVGMQTAYILWTFLVEGRLRPGVAALFMFTCRGILGYSTQLPLPQEFLGSGADFPVGNVSFFLFFSGHVAGAVIASLDMRRLQRTELAWLFDVLNALQALRLLGTRGHYTIDLAVGVGAGLLFDYLAGKYEEGKKLAPVNTSLYAPLS
ncbi:Phosphatidylcholine:diacylglycerol cholinephosphotransferase 1-like protein [Drosera capensis]